MKVVATRLSDYIFTSHALFEMERRGLSESLVRHIVEYPQQRYYIRQGRIVAQSQVTI